MPGKYDEEQAEATEKNRYGLAADMSTYGKTFWPPLEAFRGSSRSTQLARRA